MIKKIPCVTRPVLPTVFDESLSYYEVLSKVMHKTDEVITEVNELEEDVQTLENNVSSIDDRVETLEGKMETAEGDIAELQTSSSSDRLDILDLQERMEGVESETTILARRNPLNVASSVGKVLTSTGAGTASWQDVPKELPNYGAGAAKSLLMVQSDGTLGWSPLLYSTPTYGFNPHKRALMINQAGTALDWDSELPDYGVGIVGKYLKVGNDGALEWADANNSGPVLLTMGSITYAQLEAARTAFLAGNRVCMQYTYGSETIIMPAFKINSSGANYLVFEDYSGLACHYPNYTPSITPTTLADRKYAVKVHYTVVAGHYQIWYTYQEIEYYSAT